MNKAIAKRWAAALRSGKYKQGRGCLKRTAADGTVSHCCLGVLTELYQASMRRQGKRPLKEIVLDTPVGVVDLLGTPSVILGASCFATFGPHAEPEHSYLPPKVMKWAGIETADGEYGGLDGAATLEALSADNDAGKSFKQIARVIEHYAEKL